MSVTSFPNQNPRLHSFVQEGRSRFKALLPSEDFDAACWELSSLNATATSNAKRTHFTLRGSSIEALPTAYAQVVKAWTVLGGGSASRWMQRAQAARWLWSAIEERLGADAGRIFDWRDLQVADLQRAEQLRIEARSAQSSTNKTATTLADLARVLGLRGVAPPITFTPVTPRYRDSNNHRIDDPSAAGEGILTPAALDALALVFAKGETKRDRVLSAIITLCVATGLRINEIFTLPLHPIQEVEREIALVSGRRVRKTMARIVRHKGKSRRAGGGGRPSREAEWLTESLADLARLAVVRLQEETAEARAVAKRLEASNGRWIWPETERPRWLLQQDIVRVLGCSPDNANRILRTEGKIDSDRPRFRRITLPAFEAYMTKRQDPRALTVVAAGPGGRPQFASESLICLRENELHETRATLPLIRAVSHSMMDVWLKGHPTESVLSVFERFEQEHGLRFREPDGSLVQIDTHQGRRLFVTNILRAGGTVVDVARWQGREHVGDISAYDMRSMADRVALVKDGIRTGRLQGTVTRIYFQLAEDLRDAWLDGQVQSVHVGPLGLCVHDFTASPCPKNLNCLKDCGDYVVDPANPEQRVRLVQLQMRTRDALDRMRPLDQEGRIAQSWIREAEDTVRGAERAIAAIDAAPPGSGALRPFDGNSSRFAPLAGASR